MGSEFSPDAGGETEKQTFERIKNIYNISISNGTQNVLNETR